MLKYFHYRTLDGSIAIFVFFFKVYKLMYEALLKSSYLSSGHLPQQPLASCYCSSSGFLQKGQSAFSAFPIL